MRAKSIGLVLVAVVMVVGSIALAVNVASRPAVGSNMGASAAATGALIAGAGLVLAVVAVARGERGRSLQAGCIGARLAACAFLSLPILGLASGNA